jgi:hypothetical protein
MPDEPFTPTTRQFVDDQMVRDWLRKPFKPEQIGKLAAVRDKQTGKVKRPALDYVGHAAVSDRLNRIAPDWSYTVDREWHLETTNTFWVRGTMTIGGVSRPEYGDGDDPKEAIGNFIRRGAMRFGVAIDLWSREELEQSEAPSTEKSRGEAGASGPRPSELAPEGGSGAEKAPDGSATPAGVQAEHAGPGEEAGSPLTPPSPGRHTYAVAVNDCDHSVGTIDDGGVVRCLACGQPAARWSA